MAKFRRRTCIILSLFILFIFLLMMGLKALRPNTATFGDPFGLDLLPEFRQQIFHLEKKTDSKKSDKINSETNPKNLKSVEITMKPAKPSELNLEELPPLNYYLHVFYYSWYGNPQFDGKYIHWNHPVLEHWDPRIAKNYPQGRHNPPEDIGSSFYPELGSYSSRDPSVIETHMRQMCSASIGVLALSWYPPDSKDENGEPTDDLVPTILDKAHKYNLKVTFHIEPYSNRDDENMYKNVKYIIDNVGPGYIDTSIRPWNTHNTRNRVNGKYYETALSAALQTHPSLISVTSFNEWHEGTQIEKAVPKRTSSTVYLDYRPHKPGLYLELTRKWSEKYSKERATYASDHQSPVLNALIKV
ncbi:glycoprotein endo-alpha-1,2-mannosidase isoform 2-T2 [Trichechus inunguis]